MNKQKEENYNEAINRPASYVDLNERPASYIDPNERPASYIQTDNDGYVELKEEEPEGYVEPIAIHTNRDEYIDMHPTDQANSHK